jgi:hypothetical protein
MARWRAGQSGNPRGRPPTGHAFADALRAEFAKSPGSLEAIVEKVIALAMDGNIAAITFIADRLDGKPAQAIEHSGAEGGPIILITDKWEEDDGADVSGE